VARQSRIIRDATFHRSCCARQIQQVVHQAKWNADLRELRRDRLQAVWTVVNRHLFEHVYEFNIERDGSVTVVTRNRREPPPKIQDPTTVSGYSGYGRDFRLVQGTNGWEVRGKRSWFMGRQTAVTISY
jgi:hypothetical protein